MKQCPHCRSPLTVRTRLGLHLYGSRGAGLSPAIKCPNCSKWLRMRIFHGIWMSILSVGILFTGFFFRFHLVVIFLLLVIVITVFRIFAIYELYKDSDMNYANNFVIEGKDENKT